MRKAFRPLLALLLLLLFGLAGPLKAEAIRSGPNASPAHFFHDESFEFEFLRTLGAAYYGGADIMECLDTASRIGEGDEDAARDVGNCGGTGEQLGHITRAAALAGRYGSGHGEPPFCPSTGMKKPPPDGRG